MCSVLTALLVRSQRVREPPPKLFGPDTPLLFSHNAAVTSSWASKVIFKSVSQSVRGETPFSPLDLFATKHHHIEKERINKQKPFTQML